MEPRPPVLDLRSQSHGSLRGGVPSPRLHVAGDVPPELSPLDAFALQSRLLARQLNATLNEGRRVSRLSPIDVAASLSTRPGFFRSVTTDGNIDAGQVSPSAVPDIRNQAPFADRPVSQHPRVSHIPPPSPAMPFDNAEDDEEPADDADVRGPAAASVANTQPRRSLQCARRDSVESAVLPRPSLEASSYVRPSFESSRTRPSIECLQPRPSVDSSFSASIPSPTRRHESPMPMYGFDSRALAPPRSPFSLYSPRTSSIRSVSMDSQDESAPPGSATLPPPRKQSASNLSVSPLSPSMLPLRRSPSISSEMSTSSNFPRPTFNFSRPLSRASMAPIEPPSRQASSDSQPFFLADDTIHTPVSVSEEFLDTHVNGDGAPSYIYSRYSLPRGKALQRNSAIFQEPMPTERHWEQPRPAYGNVPVYGSSLGTTPPSPPSRPSTSSLGQSSATSFTPSQSFDMPRDADRSRMSFEAPSTVRDAGSHAARSDAQSVSSGSTLKPTRSLSSLKPAAAETAEDHVAKAIECHENGSLKESTYHLRIAAHQGHPTGMLLYALACRHGWGMRPNQREGVQWLRRAADCASIEVADDADSAQGGKQVNLLEKKTRQAQFALSIYELGVSHMNGWGIDQDKVLALRCFEIAGSWGDADALAEAGFCYAQGIGCKKDLKKSAQLYRQAEAKGISMVGNSWIYKSKYNDDASSGRGRSDKKSDVSPKKGRSKSRSRMFSRKKST